jgi:hypothetical protein
VKLQFVHTWDGNDYATNTDSASVSLNAWHHIVVTYNADATGNEAVIYLDGSVMATTTGSAPTGTRDSDSGGDLIIGNQSGDALTFDGFIDGVRLYSRILSPPEVLEHFNGVFTDETGLAGYWPLNEGGGTLARDASLNLNHGVLSGNAAWAGMSNAAQGPKDAAFAGGRLLAGGRRDIEVYA